jgi:acyl carrier protein
MTKGLPVPELKLLIQSAVFGAIDDINELRPGSRRIPKAPDSVLSGDAEALDSLGMVNFVVALEQRLDGVFPGPISLLDDEQVDLTSEHFRTVGAVVDYLERLHASQANAH